jgi:hypothetical protein
LDSILNLLTVSTYDGGSNTVSTKGMKPSSDLRSTFLHGYFLILFDMLESALRAWSISPHIALAVKCLVDFLTILWHSRVEGSVYRANAFSFLRSAVTVLQHQAPTSSASSILRDTLLVAISAYTTNYSLDDVKLIQEWLVRSSLVHSGCSNFIAACMTMGLKSAGRQRLINVDI